MADKFAELKENYQNCQNNDWLNDCLQLEECMVSACDIDLFFGRYPMTPAFWKKLQNLANEHGLGAEIKKLLAGEVVNESEQQAATHTHSRASYFSSNNPWAKFKEWADALRHGQLPNSTTKIKDVIHLGTGGSRLGPELLIQALGEKSDRPFRPHFVSSHDQSALVHVLKDCHPETTLVIVASKSFGTAETLANAGVARQWLTVNLSQERVKNHILAITSYPEKAMAWGVNLSHCLTFPKTIGGRFSISSAVSLIAAAYLRESQYAKFLVGMVQMDQHFATAGWKSNLPVVAALLSVFAVNILAIPTQAIIAYDSRLAGFIPYIQQLSMESLGKKQEWLTGATVWGGVGTDSQHSFHQQIMQGTWPHQVEFVVARDQIGSWRNALVQSQLMQRGNGVSGCAAIEGGHPNFSLHLPSLNATTLGALVALYEHRTYVQSVLWQLNCFDQPGVEAGKQLLKCFDMTECGLDSSSSKLCELQRKPQIPTIETM